MYYIQTMLNFSVFFFIYFFLQIFLYRFFKINLNKFFIVLFIISVSAVVGFYLYSIELLINLINLNLIIICFYFVMPAIINHAPATEIIHLITNKKINNKKKLKKSFLKGRVGKAVEKRLEINISSNLIKFNKGGFTVTKNAKKILIFLNLIKKIYKLESDAY